MAKKGEFRGLGGKIAGNAVKGMIREVEQRMASGEVISAAPSSPEEADLLKQVREENKSDNQMQ